MLKELRSTAKVEVLIPLTEDKPKAEEPATIESVEPTAPAESAPAAENAAPADAAK
jgi:peptidyl-prolyl cis-trans isomerase C